MRWSRQPASGPGSPGSWATSACSAANGVPLVHGGEEHPEAPGLHFIGYRVVLGGTFRQAGIEARQLAQAIGARAGRPANAVDRIATLPGRVEDPRPPRRPEERRHRRARRPWQDDPRRRDAVAVGLVPGEPGRRRTRHGLGRPRAREGDHDPRQEHLGPPERHEDQHHRHARATPTSEARSSGASRWSTACCFWWMPPKGRCRRRASSCARRSRRGFRSCSSSTRSTGPTLASKRWSTRSTSSFSISTPPPSRSSSRSSTRSPAKARPGSTRRRSPTT